jgi:hypothetical protein
MEPRFSMVRKLIQNIINQRSTDRQADLIRSMIRKEAQIGGQLFGPVRPGGRREFFCLDEHTWVWHEEWLDEQGQRQIATTRYEARPDRMVKVQDGVYKEISQQEATRLYHAIKQYQARVNSELYSFV